MNKPTNAAPSQPVGSAFKHWCETCNGSGAVYQEHQAGCLVGGYYACPDCDGRGYWTPLAALTPEPAAESNQWIAEAKLTLDRLSAFLQHIGAPHAVDWREWIDNAEKRVTAAQAAAVPEDEQAAFERHIRSAWKVPESYLDWALKRNDRGYYLDGRAADQWSGWQARAAIDRLAAHEAGAGD